MLTDCARRSRTSAQFQCSRLTDRGESPFVAACRWSSSTGAIPRFPCCSSHVWRSVVPAFSHPRHCALPATKIIALRIALRDTFSCPFATPWLCCVPVLERYSLPLSQRRARAHSRSEFHDPISPYQRSCGSHWSLPPPPSPTLLQSSLTRLSSLPPALVGGSCSRVTLTSPSI